MIRVARQSSTATTSPCGAGRWPPTDSWDAVYGTLGYEVRTRLEESTVGLISSFLATPYLTLYKDWSYGRTGVNQSDITWTLDGFNYTVSVRISNSYHY